MKHLFLSILLLAICHAAYAQPNLVPNHSFEDTITGCPTNAAQVTSRCKYWNTYTNASPDYYHVCGGTNVGVPSNIFGYQHAVNSGYAYVGFCNYWKLSTNYSEYVSVQISPMSIGSRYEVSFSVSLADKCKYGSSDIGVYFIDAGPSSLGTHPATKLSSVTPQISFSGQSPVVDTANWVRLTAHFVADSAYKYIVIGGFLNDNAQTLDSIPANPNSFAYYYLDSVVIKIADTISLTSYPTVLCAPDTITVTYAVSGQYFNTGNVFRLQLSDSNGSFANPVNIGTDTSTVSGTMKGVIPSTTFAGSKYKLRIVATNPAYVSKSTGTDIIIGRNKPAKPVAASNSPICANDTLFLAATCATAGVTYSWTGPNNFTSGLQYPIIPKPPVSYSGKYIVTVQKNGCTSDDTVDVNVFSDTGIGILQMYYDIPLCEDSMLKLGVRLDSSSAQTYSWTGPNNFTSSIKNPGIAGIKPSVHNGNYILTVSLGNCSATDTLAVNITPHPVFTATSNMPLCAGTNLQFGINSTFSNVSYSWVGPNNFSVLGQNPVIFSANPVHDGVYIATANLNGCKYNDTVTVAVNPLPVKPIASSNTPICVGETLNLTATTTTTGVTWSWAGPSYSSTTQNPTIANTTTAMSGNYIITANLNGCVRKDTAVVLIKPMPTPATSTSNSPVCAGDSLLISIGTSTTGTNYAWAGPASFTATTQNPFVANSTTAATGWYVASLDLNGCLFKDSTYAIVNPIPATPVASYSNPLCLGETLQLNSSAVAGATYTWTGPGNFSANNQNPTRSNMQFGDTGLYNVKATINGCTSPIGNVRVNLNAVPFVVIFASPGDTICQGDNATFTALPNNHGGTPSYQWYINGFAAGSSATSFNTTMLNNTDVVRCDMTENTKCKVAYTDASNDIDMKVLSWLPPSVTISANPGTPLAPNEYVNFTATPTNGGKFPKYQWKRNGQNVQGATSAIWSANTLNDNDKICVELISDYKCPQPLTVMSNCITVKVLTGIGDINTASRLVLYPNPNHGSYTINGDINTTGKISLTVLNILGQVIFENEIAPLNNHVDKQFNMGNVQPGVYLLRLHNESMTETIRFVVE